MHFTSTLALSAFIANAAAGPFKFPLPDGFPNPSPQQLAAITEEAQGSLPDGPLPTKVKPDGITTLQLLATNELFEVAYFTELLANITKEVPGYGPSVYAPVEKKYVVETFTAIVNQEKLHAAGVNGILASAKQPMIKPCEYEFPVSTFVEAVTLAQTFTEVVLGTLPEAQTIFGVDGGDEVPLINVLGGVLAQEAEQNGFYRFAQKKTPSAAPFLTGGSPSFAFTAIQAFIVPGSCPQPLSDIKLKTFKPLTVVSKPEAKNSTLHFAVPGPVSTDHQSLVYISGQNVPVTVCIEHVDSDHHGGNTFTAEFPFDSPARFANGLTIAAVVEGVGKTFASPDAVAAATIYGPGLIEVQ